MTLLNTTELHKINITEMLHFAPYIKLQEKKKMGKNRKQKQAEKQTKAKWRQKDQDESRI